MILHYILDARGEPVPEPDLLAWARWFEANREQRIVKRERVGPWLVATMFLGLDHRFGPGPAILWETMVFDHVTCPQCLAGKEIPFTFELSANGQRITCLRCHSTSYNRNDVEQHYCARCHVFHDDLWPPARRWWLAHDNQGRVIPNEPNS